MTTKPKYTKPELPKGIAAYYVYSSSETVCILCEARGKNSNTLPDSRSSFTPLAVGVAFFHPNDDPETVDMEKAEVISLGRALKMYNRCRPTAYAVGNDIKSVGMLFGTSTGTLRIG